MGTSTVIKTEHTMIALLYSPTAMPVLDFGLPAWRPTAATLSETIWRLALHHQLGFQVGRREDCEAATAASAGDK